MSLARHNDFHEIEDSMNKLVEEMNSISTITTGINSTMKENRAEIADLVHQSDTLTKIRFLFELPAELNAKIEQRCSRTPKGHVARCPVYVNCREGPKISPEHFVAKGGEELVEMEFRAAISPRRTNGGI